MRARTFSGKPRRMRVGFNYPWSYHRFGIDLGPNVEVDSTRWVRERSLAAHGKAGAIPLAPLNLFTHLERNLVNLKHLGIDIVRYWILCNGFNYYGSGPIKRNTPSPIPLLRFYDWRFTPPFETDQRFTYQFGLLLEKFQQHDMQIIPSLISFEFAGNPPVPPDAKGLAGGGHANCITDRNARLIFLSTMLNDLLVVSQKFKKTIFAWEVANEPYWNISPFGPLSQSPPTYALPGTDPVLTGIAKRVPEVNYEQMAEFLQEAI